MPRSVLHNCFRTGVRGVVLAIALLPLAWSSRAEALSFTIVSLVSSSQCRPDLPTCTPWFFSAPGSGAPVIEGNFVAFMSRSTSPGGFYDGIWSIDIPTRIKKKLAGTNTLVPGGTGKFSSFGGPAPSIGGGVVVFYGTDAASVGGIYTVPVGAGTIHKIATTTTTAPDGGHFTNIDHARLNGQHVVFYGQTSTGRQGIYAANVAGAGLVAFIDDNRHVNDLNRWSLERGPGFYSVYSRPVIGKSLTSFFATENLDPSLFPNAALQGPHFTDIADTLTSLEHNTTPPRNHHVGVGELSAAVGSDRVAFYAGDGGGAFTGIFKATSMTAARSFVTNQTVGPAGHKFSTFAGFAYDVSGLAFASTDTLNHPGIYFVPDVGGAISLVAGVNFFFPTLGDRALSNGRMTFYNGTIFENTIYVATPKP